MPCRVTLGHYSPPTLGLSHVSDSDLLISAGNETTALSLATPVFSTGRSLISLNPRSEITELKMT